MIRFMDFQFNNWCSKSCWFCPPQCQYKPNEIQSMNDDDFYKLILFIKQGVELNLIYPKLDICLNRYYEPMAIMDIVSSRADMLREVLPQAIISFHTNGDYLTLENINKVSKEIDDICVNLYEASMEDCLCTIVTLFNVDISKISCKQDKRELSFYVGKTRWKFTYSKMDVINIKNRGSVINELCTKDKTTPCMIHKYNMVFELDGTVMPCCDLYSKVPKHEQSIIGNAFTDSFKDIYDRLQNFNYKEHAGCKQCNGDFSKIYGVEKQEDFECYECV